MQYEIKASVKYPIGAIVKSISLASAHHTGDRKVIGFNVDFKEGETLVRYRVARIDYPDSQELVMSVMDTPSHIIQSCKDSGIRPGNIGIFLVHEEQDVSDKMSAEDVLSKSRRTEARILHLEQVIQGARSHLKHEADTIEKCEREIDELRAPATHAEHVMALD